MLIAPREDGLEDVLSRYNLWHKNIWITGHSSGGVLAKLLASHFVNKGRRVAGVYAFGSPRFATESFRKSYDDHLKNITFSYVNQRDPVPHVPRHFSEVGHIRLIGRKAQILKTRSDAVEGWPFIVVGLRGNVLHHSIDEGPVNYIKSLSIPKKST